MDPGQLPKTQEGRIIPVVSSSTLLSVVSTLRPDHVVAFRALDVVDELGALDGRHFADAECDGFSRNGPTRWWVVLVRVELVVSS